MERIICLIYTLKNNKNGKLYIGQTWNTLKVRGGKNGKGYEGCYGIWNAIQKYGWENFEYSVLIIAHTQKIADYWEKYFIAKFNSTDEKYGYNIRDGSARGKFSIATKNKMSISHKGKNFQKSIKRI